MTTLIPLIVLFVAAFVMLRMRIGRDIAVPIFLAPWYALEPDIGVGVTVAQFLLVALTVKYILYGRFSLTKIPNLQLLMAIVVLSLSSAIVTLATFEANFLVAGGELRNGWLRTLVILVKFFIYLLPFALLHARGSSVSIVGIMRVLLWSMVTLCTLGVLQVAVFLVTGIDIFPIGMFWGDDFARSGFVQIENFAVLRASSFAGEPKGLAMIAAAGFTIILAFGKLLVRRRTWRWGLVALFVVTILLTQSTSGLIALAISAGSFGVLSRMKQPLTRGTIFIALFAAASGLMTIYFYSTATLQMRAGLTLDSADTTFLEVLYNRTLGRLRVDDFDWVIVKSFLEDPGALLFGRGFGLAHLFTDPYIPVGMRRYMDGVIISPKSGLTLFLANGGLVSVFLLVVFISYTIPARRRGKALTRQEAELIRVVQIVAIPLALLAFMRVQIYEVFLIVLAIVSIKSALPSFAQLVSFSQRGVQPDDQGQHLPPSTPIPTEAPYARDL